MTAPLNRKIRWGVLGYARIARELVMPAIQRSGNSELHALASRDAAKIAEAHKAFPLPQTYTDYAALLRDPSVDAVYIPLPNSSHREWTIRAAEHGKHILCEKPLGLNAAECRDMIAAAAKHKVRLMEAFMYRYTDRTAQVVKVLRSGVLGKIKFINANFRYFLNRPGSIKLKPELGGGALYDVGCYALNFIGLVADEAAGQPGSGVARPVSVKAECVRADGIDVLFSALLQYPSGLVAAAHCGFNAHRRILCEIIGTDGTLEVPATFLDSDTPLVLTVGEERREIPVIAANRYQLEVEDFAAAILENRAPQFSLAETVRNAEVLDQLLAAV